MNTWKTSSRCSLGGCVRIKFFPSGHVHVGDTKHPDTVLVFDRAEWVAFVAGVKRGEFDVEVTA